MGVSISRLDPEILFDAYLPIVAICLIHYYIIFYYSQEDCIDLDMKSGPTSIHVSENCDENHNKTKQIDENYPPEVVHQLRAEIFALKEWKARATQEIVDRDCALVDLEQELVKQQSEFDANSEECTGHQRVIQELKSQLDQVNHSALFTRL